MTQQPHVPEHLFLLVIVILWSFMVILVYIQKVTLSNNNRNLNNNKHNISTNIKKYEPKQSKRIRFDKCPKSDGDTWVEHVVIYNPQTNEKRSYFKSINTNKWVWDEPPSGADKIILFHERKI